LKFILAVSLAAPAVSVAQNMTIYSNSLVNGWENYSYDTTLNFANTSPVHAGSKYSISAAITNSVVPSRPEQFWRVIWQP
jgi:hypothetical protein